MMPSTGRMDGWMEKASRKTTMMSFTICNFQEIIQWMKFKKMKPFEKLQNGCTKKKTPISLDKTCGENAHTTITIS
jgi:hypothetical protein